MRAQRDEHDAEGTRDPIASVDPQDTEKQAATFFAEMPWDGDEDLAQWSSSRFFALLCEPAGPEVRDGNRVR